jgi:hypothetical protein
LFATPCLDLLSKEYEITFLTPGHTLPVFTQYSFLKRVLPGCNHGDPNAKLPSITKIALNNILKDGDWQYAYHHDNDILFLQNYPEILQLKKYPVLSDKEIDISSNVHESKRFLSRTKKLMLKLQLLSLKESINYDCTVRCPSNLQLNSITNEAIVVYQGSVECLRKLPVSTINNFTKFLPNAIYLVTQETAKILQFAEKNIKHFFTHPFQQNSLKCIMNLFEARPKVLIGPDSGLTQLASSYKIPLIWLQSRIVLENVIDEQYKKFCTVYLKSDLSCKQDCTGCIITKNFKNGLKISPEGLFESEQHLEDHKKLECFIKSTPDCLQYSEKEVEEIVKLIN